MAPHRDRNSQRGHRNIRYLEQIIQVADYEGDLRQIAVTGLGHDKPTLLLTNNRDQTARQIMTHYTSRNGIEDSLGSEVNFFHLDCLASEVPLNVDLDAALTVVANGCYRWLASELDGFAEAKPKRCAGRSSRPEGRFASPKGRSTSTSRNGAQPDLEASRARHQGRSNSLGRWQDPPLHLRRDRLTRPKSVSRFPSAIFGVDCTDKLLVRDRLEEKARLVGSGPSLTKIQVWRVMTRSSRHDSELMAPDDPVEPVLDRLLRLIVRLDHLQPRQRDRRLPRPPAAVVVRSRAEIDPAEPEGGDLPEVGTPPCRTSPGSSSRRATKARALGAGMAWSMIRTRGRPSSSAASSGPATSNCGPTPGN